MSSLELLPQVLELKAEGLNNVEVGQRLGISRDAVRRLLQKTGASMQTPPKISEAKIRWGHGAAQLVKASTKEATETVVFGSDFHFPYQDDGAVASFLLLVESLQPHRVVLNGDVGDFFQLSRFNTSGSREDELQFEIDQANSFRAAVREVCPDAVIDETEGNHDNRILSYVANKAGALRSLRALKPAELFEYRLHKINWHPGCGYLLRPDFLVKHGTIVRSEAGASAKAEYTLAGVSGISGHTHRLAPYRKEGYVQREWWEQGCMCRTDPDYVVGKPNWRQGCVVGEFSTKTSARAVFEVPYIDGALRLGRDAY